MYNEFSKVCHINIHSSPLQREQVGTSERIKRGVMLEYVEMRYMYTQCILIFVLHILDKLAS